MYFCADCVDKPHGYKTLNLLFTHELKRNETQTSMDSILIILTETKFHTGMRFSCDQSLPKTKWICEDILDIAFNEHVRLKVIAVILREMTFHFGW